MPTLPIPLISSLILGFLLVRIWFLGGRHGPLVLLLAVCAVQGLIISLAQHYRVPGFQFVQPVTATFVPAMAWIAFQTTAVRGFQASDGMHLLGPLLALVSLATFPPVLDLLIPALFLGYGSVVLWIALKGADETPRLSLDAGDMPVQIWRIIGAALIASAFSDVLIIAVQVLGAPHLQPWIISIYTSVMLLVIGGLSLSSNLNTTTSEKDAGPEVLVSDQDTQIVAKLDELMNVQSLYLNPELTLSQLSRKMMIPTKQLSGAINRVTGHNVSRYINARRIKAAQAALVEGQNVTNAMLSAGFNTKSNFNREFLRIAGKSPSAWLADQGTTKG